MPVYESQRGILTTFSALSCALILAFLFTSREFIPKTKSKIGNLASLLIPLGFICATFYCGYEYVQTLIASAHYYKDQTLTEAMKHVELNSIPGGIRIMTYHILIIVFAECAFFFMAFREWKPKDSEGNQ